MKRVVEVVGAQRHIYALAQRPDLPIEQALQVAYDLYQFSPSGSEERGFATQLLLSLVPHLNAIKDNDRDNIYGILSRMVPQFDKINTSTPQWYTP